MTKVWVVTGFELGWDCVVGIFDAKKVTCEQIEERFPESRYYVQKKDIEKDLSGWDA
jgi:hypothetical protein